MESKRLLRELEKRSENYRKSIEEIAKVEKKAFPKEESLWKNFDKELEKRNVGLIYSEINEELVGYVMYAWPSSISASITKLAVKEKYRRQGNGELLLKAAIEKCRTRKIECICLHVDPLRAPAVTLYKKLGFCVDEVVKSYYSPDRDAYRMYLNFGDT